MRLIPFIALAALGVGVAAGADAPRGPGAADGRWRTDDGAAIVRVAACGARLCGAIERVLDPRAPRNDVNAPDAAQRARPLVGTTVLSGFTVLSGGRWDGGTAYDPKAGRSYRSRLALLSPDRLQVTGCVWLVCRSRVWTRAD